MDPKDATNVAVGLAKALETPQETDSYPLSNLGEALAALAALTPSARQQSAKRR